MTRTMTLVVAVTLMCSAGCAAREPTMATPHQTSAAAPARITPLTPHGIVTALEHEGLPVNAPVDASAAECPAAGCAQAVVTDRLRILMFGTTGTAQLYAGSRSLRQVGPFVVAFAPVVEQSEQDRYWSAIEGLVR